MNIEWVKVNDFAGIPLYYPIFPLDLKQWIGRVISNNTFERETANFVSNYLSTHDDCVCVDVGANIGFYTVLMAYYAKKVYAFEPATKYFDLLTECCKKNGIEDKCVLFKKAASNCESEKELPVYDQSATFHEPGNYVPELTEKVSCTTLDSTIHEKVDLIKIDCDGHDPFVIYGAENLIREHLPVIVVEVAWHHYEKAGFDLESFYWYMHSMEYVMCSEHNIDEIMTLQGFLSHRNRTNISSINVICFPVKKM